MRNSVPAEQLHAVSIEHVAQPRHEPLGTLDQSRANQHADRFGSLGREVGKVHRDQLPRDVGRIGPGAVMHALGDRVMGDD